MNTTESQWFEDPANVATLTTWMTANGYDVDDVAFAAREPWNFSAEYYDATHAPRRHRSAFHGAR